MSDYDVVIGILAFLIISHLTLVEFGAGEYFFQDVNLTQEQLQSSPQAQSGDPQFFNLRDSQIIDQANVTNVDSDTLPNSSLDFDTPSVWILENGSEKGYLSYNIPEAKSLEIKTQKESILIGTRTYLVEDTYNFNITSTLSQLDQDKVTELRGESSVTLTQDSNIVTVVFTPDTGLLTSKEPRLYEIKATEDEPTDSGFLGLGVLIDTIYDIATTPLRFYDALSQFPIYFKIFYSGLIIWMIADILQIG